MLPQKLNKLFDRLSRWSFSYPISDYRYKGHNTIYISSTDEFNPSEREILVHRYVHRNLKHQFIRFSIVKHPSLPHHAWRYGQILAIRYGNAWSNGYIEMSVFIANNFSIETICISSSDFVKVEIIPKAWFIEMLKTVAINDEQLEYINKL